MPRNGSGTYSPPASSWNPPVNGQLMDPVDWAALLADITTALTASLAKDGQTTPSADIPLGNFKLYNVGAATSANQALVYGQSGASLADLTVTGTLTNSGTSIAAQAVFLTGIISPSQYTSDQNDLAPTGFSTAGIVRFSTDASRNFTGLAGGSSGRTVILANVGTQNAVLKNENAGSSAANRFSLNADVTLGAKQCATLWYDTTASRWLVISTSLLSAGSSVVVSGVANIRQTVANGPVDSGGLPNYGGSTGGTTVTTTNFASTDPFCVNFAYGFDPATGKALDYFGVETTNQSWTGLSTNGTMYLYVDYNTSTGARTYGSTTVAPVYQVGGTYSVTNNQHTYNWSVGVMKVGNGSTASQVARVFVGEVTVAGGVVTAIVWYALNGTYTSGWTATLPGASTASSYNHNIGIPDVGTQVEIECTTADANYAVGDRFEHPFGNGTNGGVVAPDWSTYKTCGFTTQNIFSWGANDKTTGVMATFTLANWKYRMLAKRKW
jgi:hypothetical protein